MSSKIIKLIGISFVIIWATIILSEFLRYDSKYSQSLKLFQYYDFLLFVVVIGSGMVWFLRKRKNKPLKYFNGFSIFFGMLLLNLLAICFFYGKLDGLSIEVGGLITLSKLFIGISLCIFLVYVVVWVIGVIFTTIFPLKIVDSDLPIIQIVLGVIILTTMLFFLGAIGLLNVFILTPIFLIILSIYWRLTGKVIKETLFTPIPIPDKINYIGVFSFLFLTLFLVFNYTLILRPFPIGSDSLNLYVNLPSLLSEYGSLVKGNQPYNWSLFMSLGMVVFGRLDVVLALSFLGGLLSLFALFQLSRKWLDVNYSALVLLLFYSMPMINFLSYMDMKVDMGLLLVTLSILLLYYNWLVPPENEKASITNKGFGLLKAKAFFKKRIPPVLKNNRLLAVAGLLAGFAFGIKLTVLFFFFALLCSIWFVKGDMLSFLTAFFLCLATVLILQLDAQPGLRQFHQFVPILQWGLLSIGLGLIVYLFIKRKNKLFKLLTYSMVIGAFFVLPVLPWLGKNFIETGKINTMDLLNGKKESPIFDIDNANNASANEKVIIKGIYQVPEEIAGVEKRRNKDLNKSISEDLHRFMGYELMPVRYLSLPYDVFIKTNISDHFTDVGFVLLLLFPLLFLFPGSFEAKKISILSQIIFMVLSTFLLILSIPGAFLNHNKLTNPGQGIKLLESETPSGLFEVISNQTNKVLLEIYTPINNWLSTIYTDKDPFTYTVMILLFLLIIFLIQERVKRYSRITQSMILFMLMYFFLWWILGSGVAWYGILIFTLPYIFLLKGVYDNNDHTQQSNPKWNLYGTGKKAAVLLVCTTWLFLAFAQRTSNYNPIDKERAKHIYYPSIMEYQIGNLSEEKLTDYHFPSARQLSKVINRDKKARVYRIGTPINFFIDKNDKRVLGDNYLDFFERLKNFSKTKEQIIQALKNEGFGYIVFDLNMFSYDETPGKTLTSKFIQFMNTLYNNPMVELVATDRTIKLDSTGEVIFEVFQDKGTIVNSGKIALYRIK